MTEITEGKLLKDIRYKLRLTQKEFARRLGSRQQIITMIENGQREVPKSIIRALNKVFSINFYEAERTPLDNIAVEKDHIAEMTYRLSLTATIKNLDVVNKVIGLLQDVEEINVLKADERYFKQEI